MVHYGTSPITPTEPGRKSNGPPDQSPVRMYVGTGHRHNPRHTCRPANPRDNSLVRIGHKLLHMVPPQPPLARTGQPPPRRTHEPLSKHAERAWRVLAGERWRPTDSERYITPEKQKTKNQKTGSVTQTRDAPEQNGPTALPATRHNPHGSPLPRHASARGASKQQQECHRARRTDARKNPFREITGRTPCQGDQSPPGLHMTAASTALPTVWEGHGLHIQMYTKKHQ
jgi:hypothetical protein